MNEFFSSAKTYVIGVIIVGVFGGLSGFVGLVHNYIVMPMIDEHIDERATLKMRAWVDDSARIYINQVLISKGTGFRGQLEAETHISKHKIVEILGRIIVARDSMKFFYEYQRGYNDFVLNLMTRSIDTLGTTVYYTGDDYMFRDTMGLVWDAIPKHQNFVFYPPYLNNERLKCYPIPKE